MIPIALEIAALVLALVELFLRRGESLIAWAVVVLVIALLWGRL